MDKTLIINTIILNITFLLIGIGIIVNIINDTDNEFKQCQRKRKDNPDDF